LFSYIAKAPLNPGQTKPANLVFGIENNCPLNLRQRLFRLIFLQQDCGQSELRFGKIRIVQQCLFKVPLCILDVIVLTFPQRTVSEDLRRFAMRNGGVW
jgi:hypothetical protein